MKGLWEKIKKVNCFDRGFATVVEIVIFVY